MSLGTSTSHSFSLKTGNTRALTIDTSQNATFAGDVEIRSGNKLILQRPNNGVATEISTDSTGAMILNSINSEGFFFNNAGTNAFKLDPINATFAGTIRSNANEGKLILNSTATNGNEYQFISIDTGSLGIFDGTAYRLWIADSGYVGIGTTSPDHKLRVNGDTRLGNLHIKTSDFGVGGTGKTIYADGAGSGVLGFISTTAFDFSNGSTSRMRITSGGTICVGNTGAGDRTRLDVTAGGSTNFVLQARGTSNGADNTTTTNVLRAVSNDENNWSHAQFNASGYKFGYQSSGTNYRL